MGQTELKTRLLQFRQLSTLITESKSVSQATHAETAVFQKIIMPPGPLTLYASDIHDISTFYPSILHDIFTLYASDIHGILTLYASDIHDVLTLNPSDIHDVLTLYPSDIHGILTFYPCLTSTTFRNCARV